MPTPCQKCFTIEFTPCAVPVDCDGASSTVAGLSWDVVEANDPVDSDFGAISLSAAGGSGSFSLTGSGTNAVGSIGNCGGTLTARFCNTVNAEVVLQLTFTIDWEVTVTTSPLGGGGSSTVQIDRAGLIFDHTALIPVFGDGTDTLSGTDTIVVNNVACAACSVTEFVIGFGAAYNCGSATGPASASFSMVGTLAVVLV